MAAEWHPADGFEPLKMCLFVGASYTNMARYPTRDHGSSTLACTSSSAAECTPKSTISGSLARTSLRQLSRRSTPSRNIDSPRLHSSTRPLPRLHSMTNGHCEQHCVACIVQQVVHKLWRRVHGHARNHQKPSNQPGHDAGSADKHPEVLHGCRPTAPKQHLCPRAATAHVQQSQRQMQQRRSRGRRFRRQKPTISLIWFRQSWSTAVPASTYSLQTLG